MGVVAPGCGGCSEDVHPDADRDRVLYATTGATYLAHEVIVKRDEGASDDDWNAALGELGAEVVEADSATTRELGYYRVLLPGDVVADEAISRLVEARVAETAERNYVVEIVNTPNDPSFSALWGMSAIHAPEAWNQTTGSAEVLVAVSDTGVDYNHPDLAANMWTNASEIPGNGVDDDHNGYIDDVRGYDFANNDADPMDDHNHGTHVSGTIGGVGNNGVGVAGVNWTVSIQAVKFLSASGSGSLWGGAQSIIYAAKNGARVVNASWGCPGCYSQMLADAIDVLKNAGGLFVAAAGNSANNNDAAPFYPANHTNANVLAVAAIRSGDTLASFSNYGATTVDVAAPGVSILSSLPGNRYAYFSGTSMAAPHVAGSAALYLSTHPSATYAGLVSKMIASCDPIPVLAGRVVCNGRINLEKLINSDSQPPAAPRDLQGTAGSRGEIALTWAANTEPDLANYRVRWGVTTGTYTGSQDVPKTETATTIEGLTVGLPYYFATHAVDQSGNVSQASNEVVLTPADLLAPPQVLDLAARPIAGDPVSGHVVATSGTASVYYDGANAFDGDISTSWVSEPRVTATEQYVIVAFDEPKTIQEVQLAASQAFPEFFPIDFDIEVSLDGTDWEPVGSMRGVIFDSRGGGGGRSPDELIAVPFTPVFAGYVRIRALTTYRHESGVYYAALGEISVLEAAESVDSVTVTFHAPGDDPGRGFSASYDLRASTSTITEGTFGDADPISIGPPSGAGVRESFVVGGLTGETTYYFALKAEDDAGNVSPMSNVAVTSTLRIPPETVVDLVVESSDADSVTLRWTAPGDDGSEGQAYAYDLRYAMFPITAATFADATQASDVPPPGLPGSEDSARVQTLQQNTLYYFAVRAFDSAGNAGGISNVVTAIPTIHPDRIAPAAIVDLQAIDFGGDYRLAPTVHSASSQTSTQRGAAKIIDRNLLTSWVSNAGALNVAEWVILDLGALAAVGRVRMHPAAYANRVSYYPEDFEFAVSVDAINWTPVIHVEGFEGTHATWNEWGTEPTYARYIKLNVTRRGPGACVAGMYCASSAVEVGELEIYAQDEETDALLTWVAPGDDAWIGTAAMYDVRTALVALTEANFASASSLMAPVPSPSGTVEMLWVPPLALETTHYFAVRSIDDQGNVGGLSNIASITTRGTPPAAVSDLAVESTGITSISLGFTATGDDGVIGAADSYELRYSTSPVTPQNFSDATLVESVPPPSAPGTHESITVDGLDHTTTYYIALRVRDDAGNVSLLSNVVRADTLDGTPPSQVTDLTATAVDETLRAPLSATVLDSSGSYSPEMAPEKAIDGSATTAWMTPGRTEMANESIRVSLGTVKPLSRLRLRPASGYTDLFPVDFRVEVRPNASAEWTTAVSETGFRPSEAGYDDWALGAVQSLEVRLTATRSAQWGGKYYAAIAEIELYDDGADYSRARLSWTAPGNNGNEGRATRYELRVASAPIDASSWSSAALLSGPPTPANAGSLERYTAEGLNAETRYCFAVRAYDARGNAGEVSNSPCMNTPGQPPGSVTDLRETALGATTAAVAWTAPGSDGQGGSAVHHYEIRLSSGRIHESNWSSATLLSGPPTPTNPGSAQSYALTNLTSMTTYFVALRAFDAADNASGISNNVTFATLDNVPPSAIANLAAATFSASSGALSLTWTAPGDSGMAGTAASYDLRASESPITEANFSSAREITIGTPKPSGSTENVTVTSLSAERLYYIAVKAFDSAGNVSAISNVASARTRDEAPSRTTDLAVRSATANTVSLGWTAPGDDGAIGTATSYSVRWSRSTITDANFSSATPIAGAPTPGAPGSSQSLTVDGLTPGITYYFALKTTDDRGNVSQLSNIASTTTPDTVAPAAITDLAAATGTSARTLRLTWTAPGDDGSTGTAVAYELRWSSSVITAANFGAATPVTPPSPAAGGTSQSFVLTSLPDEREIYVAIKTRDDANNWSALSNVPSAWTLDAPPARTTDLRQSGATQTTITVRWTAAGDDGTAGTATAYDLRYSSNPITDANFGSAPAVPTSAPKSPGSTETALLSGLAVNRTYYVALKTRDDRNNLSTLSNVATIATTDPEPPGQITGLAAFTGSTAGTVRLTWTATGDDGSTGRATSYELRYSTAAITESDWSSATVTPIAITPKTAGQAETYTASDLTGERTFYFAIRAVDDAGNRGAVSNSPSAATPPIVPARITDLAATASAGAATATFTATGDDGTTGTATSYDLRYSRTVITAANFGAATRWTSTPTPMPAGSRESIRVTGLLESTMYYFAIKAIDDLGGTSDMSNVASTTTPDITPPAAPDAFSATTPGSSTDPLVARAAAASSVLGTNWVAANAIDGSGSTAWCSAASVTDQTQYFAWDLGALTMLDRVRLMPDSRYAQLFPTGLGIELSPDGSNWTRVAREESFDGARGGEWLLWGFRSREARYVRITATKTATSFDQHYAIVAEGESYVAHPSDGRVRLAWLAPGDDGAVGTAASYQVYRSATPITVDNVGSATVVAGAPTPTAAGTLQTLLVAGLEGEHPYYFAMRAIDDAGNVGALTASVPAQTSGVAPAPIIDLAATTLGTTSVRLAWTATGDDHLTGTVSLYEVRHSTSSITASNFALATLVPKSVGGPAGTAESVTVTGLTPGLLYRFAVVAKDEAQNASYLSNVAVAETQAEPDTTPPSRVTDLVVNRPLPGGLPLLTAIEAASSEQSAGFGAENLVDGDPSTAWSSAVRSANVTEWVRVELSEEVTSGVVRVVPSIAFSSLFPPDFDVRVSPDGLSWTTIGTEHGATGAPSEPYEYEFLEKTTRYIEYRATTLARHTTGYYYAVVAEISVTTADEPSDRAVVQWTAPGDDGHVGRAAEYDVRYGPCPVNFATATQVTTWAPLTADSPERYVVDAIPSGTCFALTAADESNNTSPISNPGSTP